MKKVSLLLIIFIIGINAQAQSWSELPAAASPTFQGIICTDASGNVYAVASTSSAPSINNVFKWNGTTWSELGTGSNALNNNNGITSIVADASGDIYAACDTTVAKWNGTTWSELETPSNPAKMHGYIRSLCVDGSGNLYAAGDFSNANHHAYVGRTDETDHLRPI